ncbi:MAG: glycosyltransferase family 2 protein [Candidatus Aminicenantes bacterium]|nr:glycosyltransferase family 2 protein [Candidatus Aminicenantes bacterium]
MENLNAWIVVLYFVVLSILAMFGSHRYYMVYLYLKNKNAVPRPKGRFSELPRVTIQLPMYNEMYVAERLIDAVVKIDYPRERLDIQVLDDSTDETVSIASRRVEYHRRQGVDISYLHRRNRQGFKAGALEEGMKVAKGEFIAVFDADFLPHKRFLMQAIHFFTSSEIGMVQMRWSHLNRNFSLITNLQSIFLDGHFVIEHTARNRSGRFFNFNGTAGIWRRSAIIDGGGWQHDTLTEDLDLSYRAQMKGWKFIYLAEHSVPAELPVDVVAFKTQQHRWAKGSIQTAKKLLPRIFRSSLPLRVKVEAFFHLAANIAYLLMVPLSISILPVVIFRRNLNWGQMVIYDVPLFLLATASVSAFYIVSQKELYSNWTRTFKYLPLLMGLGIGLSVNNSLAVLEALLNKESEFVRTPKFGIEKKNDHWVSKKYKGNRNLLIMIVELALGFYFTFAVITCIIEEIWLTLPFLVLFQYGYLYISFLSLSTIFKNRFLVKKTSVSVAS